MFQIDEYIRRLNSLATSIPHITSCNHVFAKYLSPDMGRPTWATAEQLEFLHSKTSKLDHAKATTGLLPFYTEVSTEFHKKWGPKPTAPTDPPLSIEELMIQNKGKAELHRKIVEWFKYYRKQAKKRGPGIPLPGIQPKPRLLDLTGKSKRKTRPYQLHQAFSVLYWRPPGSPLREEVEKLWETRNEADVHKMLSPFLQESLKSSNSLSEKLVFHMAVMRWKVNALTAEELTALNLWIDEQQKSKEQARMLPWMQEADEHDDLLFAENAHIQSHIDDLPSTVQTAVEEIERHTGFKAMLFLGGLEPKTGGISSHLYFSGRTVETGKTFNEVYPEVNGLRTCFHEWLQMTYTDEERKRRCTPGAASLLSMSTPIPAKPPADADPELAVTAIATRGTPPTRPPCSNPGDAVVPPLPPAFSDLPRDRDPSPPSEDLDPMDIADALTDREPDFRIPDNGNTPAPDAAPTQPWLSTAGRGTFNPDGVDEDFICKAVIAYWEIVPGGQKWVEMIESYLGLAKCSLAKGQPQRLSTKFRPQEVEIWMKTRKRSPDRVPTIRDPNDYGSRWIGWWTEVQPLARDVQVWPFPKEFIDGIHWQKLPFRGQNGIFLAIMAISWWAYAVRLPGDVAYFEEAVGDLHWVIQELIRTKQSLQPQPAYQDPLLSPQLVVSPPPSLPPPSPSPSHPPPPSRSAPSSSGAHTWRRAEGKRVVKPSRKVRDTLA